jgi:hypothetical protein
MKILFCFLFILPAFAQSVYLRHCFQSGDTITFGFESCVNSNTDTVSRHTNGYYRRCYEYNNGPGVSWSFESCINQNFNAMERDLGNSLYLRTCYNNSSGQVSPFYPMCINDNFRRIESFLNRQKE